MTKRQSRCPYRIWLASAALSLVISGPALSQESNRPSNDPAKIPVQTLRELKNEVVPAIESGDFNSAAARLADILNRSQPSVVRSIDQLLIDRGFPTATSIYADQILQLLRQGDPSLTHAPSASQLKLLGPEFLTRVKTVIVDLNSNEALSGKAVLPRDWNAAEEFFWRFHVAKNELDSAIQLVNFSQRISKPFLESRAAIERDPQLATELREFDSCAIQLHQAAVGIVKNEAKYRLVQLEDAIDDIHSALDFRTKFIAMTSLRSAKLFFDEFFETQLQEFGDQAAARAFAEKVQNKIAFAESGNSDIVEKVDLFQQGLHWWFRGRYGAGSMAQGLLKPASALNNSNAMFGLYMPRTRPEPPSSPTMDYTGEGDLPFFERRHYYTWPIGHRESIAQGRQPKQDLKIRVATTTNQFY